jgi:hypothetical protein
LIRSSPAQRTKVHHRRYRLESFEPADTDAILFGTRRDAGFAGIGSLRLGSKPKPSEVIMARRYPSRTSLGEWS